MTTPTLIERIWHGWTTRANADAYEMLLRTEIFGHIASRRIHGYRGIRLLRREVDDEVELVTIMRFDDLDAVRAFAGDDYERSVVPPEARRLLARFDERAARYRVIVDRSQDASG